MSQHVFMHLKSIDQIVQNEKLEQCQQLRLSALATLPHITANTRISNSFFI